MPKLNQVLAVEKGAKAAAESAVTRAYHAVQKRDLFAGLSRTYTPKDDDGEQLPPEGTRVVETVPGLVLEFSAAMERLFDVTATKVWANTAARADVVLHDQIVLAQVPVEYLLFLEKRLVDVQTFLSKLPTLDPATEWRWDNSTATYVSTPVVTHRTKKVLRNHVKSPATEKHPAQVDVFTEDETMGYWQTVKFSSAVPVTQVAEWLHRTEELQAAVKFAREEANSLEVQQAKVGERLLEAIFGTNRS